MKQSLAIFVLEFLAKFVGQDAIWEALKEVVERRTKIKLIKLDEQTDLREIENDILEEKKLRRLDRQKRISEKRKADQIKKENRKRKHYETKHKRSEQIKGARRITAGSIRRSSAEPEADKP